jgi:acetolactate synthase-1/2/3 large subunit
VVVEFAATTRRHGMHRAGIEIVGDIRQMLRSIGAKSKGSNRRWPNSEVVALRSDLKSAFAPQGEWGPSAIFAAARRLAPRDAIATADSGAHRILLSQEWECYAPRDLRQSSAFCTMGVSVPLAAGSKLAEPGRAVIAFVGDAGLEMGMGELATLRDLGLAVVIVVLVDRSLALIEMKQRASGLPNVGVDFAATDFGAIARAYGGNGYDVDDMTGFEAAFSAALTAPNFSVIACSIDQRSYDGLI